jgi:hypothetical protein
VIYLERPEFSFVTPLPDRNIGTICHEMELIGLADEAICDITPFASGRGRMVSFRIWWDSESTPDSAPFAQRTGLFSCSLISSQQNRDRIRPCSLPSYCQRCISVLHRAEQFERDDCGHAFVGCEVVMRAKTG